MLLLDVSRAYMNSEEDQTNPTFVQLPQEDPASATLCGRLRMCMYGTRGAADGWQTEYSTMLVQELEFTQGISHPNVFRHEQRGIKRSVHGDDFIADAGEKALDWMECEIKKRYECTVQPRMGPGAKDAKSGLVLNRVIHWKAEGLEYEADPRQVERLVADCGLGGAKPVGTPGVKTTTADLEGDEPLRQELQTTYRAAAARCKYVAVDRPDAQ